MSCLCIPRTLCSHRIQPISTACRKPCHRSPRMFLDKPLVCVYTGITRERLLGVGPQKWYDWLERHDIFLGNVKKIEDLFQE